MPVPRAAVTALAALLVMLDLSGWTASSPLQPSAAPTRAVRLATVRSGIVDDPASSSLVLVPKRSNGGLVVFLHGWGQTRWSLLRRAPEATVARAVSAAGFTVLAADAHGKAWGDAGSVSDYRLLIERTQRRYGLRDVFLMGESMGGLATMQLGRLLPDVRASVAWFPVCDVRTMRQPRFRASIREAWRGGSTAPVGPVAVGDTPLIVWASPDDRTVDAATNAAVCVAKARAAGADVTYFRTTGRHGDPSNYRPATVVRFFERYRTPSA